MNIQYYFRRIQQRLWNFAVRLEMLRIPGGDEHIRRVKAIHRRLRVPRNYSQHGLPFHRDASVLVPVPCGLNGALRPMSPTTHTQFLSMQAAAAEDGVSLMVRWAFRSTDDQANLIRDQISTSKSRIEDLLSWIAAPGHSEHHTGQALDFECIPADVPFEETQAFAWLTQNAEKFQFRLSYPRSNANGIIYEPWHWYCYSDDVSSQGNCVPQISPISGETVSSV